MNTSSETFSARGGKAVRQASQASIPYLRIESKGRFPAFWRDNLAYSVLAVLALLCDPFDVLHRLGELVDGGVEDRAMLEFKHPRPRARRDMGRRCCTYLREIQGGCPWQLSPSRVLCGHGRRTARDGRGGVCGRSGRRGRHCRIERARTALLATPCQSCGNCGQSFVYPEMALFGSAGAPAASAAGTSARHPSFRQVQSTTYRMTQKQGLSGIQARLVRYRRRRSRAVCFANLRINVAVACGGASSATWFIRLRIISPGYLVMHRPSSESPERCAALY